MPQFKSIVTGNLATLTDQYAQASGGDSVWERIADEASEETEMRLQREASDAYLEEARANKVEIEVVPEPTPEPEPVASQPIPSVMPAAVSKSEGSDL